MPADCKKVEVTRQETHDSTTSSSPTVRLLIVLRSFSRFGSQTKRLCAIDVAIAQVRMPMPANFVSLWRVTPSAKSQRGATRLLCADACNRRDSGELWEFRRDASTDQLYIGIRCDADMVEEGVQGELGQARKLRQTRKRRRRVLANASVRGLSATRHQRGRRPPPGHNCDLS
jgi:hypothetical protein